MQSSTLQYLFTRSISVKFLYYITNFIGWSLLFINLFLYMYVVSDFFGREVGVSMYLCVILALLFATFEYVHYICLLDGISVNRVVNNDNVINSSNVLSFIQTKLDYSIVSIKSCGFIKEFNNIKFPLLDPWFITGFTDGEGSFILRFRKNSKSRTGWVVQPVFQIILHRRDLLLLEAIKSQFNGVGSIGNHGANQSRYIVTSLTDLRVILAHFEKYPLMTQKRGDYFLFKRAVDIMLTKTHLSITNPANKPEGVGVTYSDGFQEIVSIRASMNNGLTDELRAAFPNITLMERPFIKDKIIPSKHWIAGFTSAEGCFKIFIRTTGFTGLKFAITQHSRDELLISSIVDTLGCGKCYRHPTRDNVDYLCFKFTDIAEKIIPLFQEYPIQGVKSLDYRDWTLAAELIKNKDHLTPEGKAKILQIKAGMNKGRLNIYS